LLVCVRVDDDAAAHREAEAHLQGQYGLGLEAVERWTLLGSIETVVEQLEPYLAAGVQEILMMPLGRDPLVQYEHLAEVRARLVAAAQTEPRLPAGEARA
jgi:alkanesulfonate monooxygenase SsuD/methylene tetrahydromethanopterin reductase-like flavin-dependent oxidoreductase (luciferase family)